MPVNASQLNGFFDGSEMIPVTMLDLWILVFTRTGTTGVSGVDDRIQQDLEAMETLRASVPQKNVLASKVIISIKLVFHVRETLSIYQNIFGPQPNNEYDDMYGNVRSVYDSYSAGYWSGIPGIIQVY